MVLEMVILFTVSCSGSSLVTYIPIQFVNKTQCKIVVRKNFFGNKLIKCFNKIFNSREEVQDFFRTMDRDFDQKLTFAEFMGEESHIEKLFKSMDKNNDGYVTKKVNLCTYVK